MKNIKIKNVIFLTKTVTNVYSYLWILYLNIIHILISTTMIYYMIIIFPFNLFYFEIIDTCLIFLTSNIRVLICPLIAKFVQYWLLSLETSLIYLLILLQLY